MTEHYGKSAHVGERWTFADKAKRDALAKFLKLQGWEVKRYHSRNQCLHPMYVDDKKQGLTAEQMGFGNTIYKTSFAALYMLRITGQQYSRRQKDAPKPNRKVGQFASHNGYTVLVEFWKGRYVFGIYSQGISHPIVRFGMHKARAIQACQDEIAAYIKQHGE